MSKKLNSIQRELAGAFRSGNIFFVLYEILNLGHYLVNKLLYLMCIPLWNLSDRIKGKYMKKNPPPVEKDWSAELKKIISDLPAGEQLEVRMLGEKMKKELEESGD